MYTITEQYVLMNISSSYKSFVIINLDGTKCNNYTQLCLQNVHDITTIQKNLQYRTFLTFHIMY